jgi:hypothetical protein
MVYHYNNHFKNYSIIEGLIREKLYIDYGKRLNNIYFFNLKHKYFKIIKINFNRYKLYFINCKYIIEDQKNRIIIQKSLEKKSNLFKAYRFLNKTHISYNTFNNTNLSNVVTNYFKKKYL